MNLKLSKLAPLFSNKFLNASATLFLAEILRFVLNFEHKKKQCESKTICFIVLSICKFEEQLIKKKNR